METITIKINIRRSRRKQLIGLIHELEEDALVEIQKTETYSEVKTAIRAMKPER